MIFDCINILLRSPCGGGEGTSTIENQIVRCRVGGVECN